MIMYDVLVKEYNACPPDCALCEEACAKRRGEESAGSAIKAIHVPAVEFHSITVCNQCGKPNCAEICPTGAINKSETDGTVRINEQKCVGCGLCTLACPYGGVDYDPKRKISFKCDKCDGEPECVKACKYGVLSFARASSVYSYLKEDTLSHGGLGCPGCAGELSSRLVSRIMGEKSIYFGCAGCSAMAFLAFEGFLGITGVAQPRPSCGCLMTNIPSTMTGVKRFFEKKGKEVYCIAFVGDGATSDVGFQPLSGAVERGERIIYICNDNEAYMNTGVQRSGTTPLFAWTTTTPVGERAKGKSLTPKYVPLLLALQGATYVATATIAYPEDFIQKLIKAKEAVKEGMVYLHLFSPCTVGWRSPASDAVLISRTAVQTNYFPLWEAENGKFSFTYQPPLVKPINEYTKLMGRFRHLNEQELSEFQEMVDRRFAKIKALAA